MSDVRERLAEALRESLAPWMTGFCWGAEVDIDEDGLLATVDDLGDDLAGELLSMPGIAIVEIPAPLPGRVAGEPPKWEVGPTFVRVDHYGRILVDGDVFEIAEARALAARLLAAAGIAEKDGASDE